MKLKMMTPVFTVLEIQTTLPATENPDTFQLSYIIGAIIAFMVFGYLIYSLLKPDKF